MYTVVTKADKGSIGLSRHTKAGRHAGGKRTMRKAQLIAGLAAVLGTSLTLAACGGQSSSDDSGSTGSSSSSSTSQSSSTAAKDTSPIKIGVTAEKTGPVPSLGTAAIGMQKA